MYYEGLVLMCAVTLEYSWKVFTDFFFHGIFELFQNNEKREIQRLN